MFNVNTSLCNTFDDGDICLSSSTSLCSCSPHMCLNKLYHFMNACNTIWEWCTHKFNLRFVYGWTSAQNTQHVAQHGREVGCMLHVIKSFPYPGGVGSGGLYGWFKNMKTLCLKIRSKFSSTPNIRVLKHETVNGHHMFRCLYIDISVSFLSTSVGLLPQEGFSLRKSVDFTYETFTSRGHIVFLFEHNRRLTTRLVFSVK